jgi:glycosyltransferase involved in cell wall biosynthesis
MTAGPPQHVTLLHVATVPAAIRNFFIPYADHFRQRGWTVLAAARDCLGVEPIEQAFDGTYDVPFSRSIFDPSNVVRALPAVQRLLDATRPDLVHVHTPIASFVTRLAVRRIPPTIRPAIAYTAHGFHFHAAGNPVFNRVFETAERIGGRWTDRLIVINDEDERAALRLRIVPRQRLIRMPGVGIDTSVYARSRVEPEQIALLRQTIGIASQAPLFTSVAELHPNKRHERTIEALSRMTHPGTHLAIAGDGEMRGQLESAARRFGVWERVHFLGFVGDIRPLVATSTAVVLSSEREGLARTLMEALSLEVPVIASDARGNAELVGADGGFIVPNGEPEGLARAMDRLVAEPELAGTMGRRGRSRMVDHYSQEAVIAMHEAMYAAMLRERTASQCTDNYPRDDRR